MTRKMVLPQVGRHAVSDLLKQHAHHLWGAILARALTGRADLIHLMRLRIAFEMIPLPPASWCLPPHLLPASCFAQAVWFDLQVPELAG